MLLKQNIIPPVTFVNVTKQDLDKVNLAQDLPTLLKNTPSVISHSDSGSGIGYSSIRIRGSDQTRVNVTINGVPYNDSESMQVYWVDLPDFASSIESIQVQRGVEGLQQMDLVHLEEVLIFKQMRLQRILFLKLTIP